MIAFKLAFRNLIGAGLRTWLNVSVLSFAFVVIVFYNGYMDGWYREAYRDTKEWEIGNGQLWHPAYDPYDYYTLQDAHAPVSGALDELVASKQIIPVLISQATIYPQGRMQNVLLRGIDPNQQILKIPTASMDTTGGIIPAVIGKRMAHVAKLKKGDHLLLRWRDKNGTFDAKEIYITDVFSSNVSTIDNGNIWIPLSSLQKMTGFRNEATLFVVNNTYSGGNVGSWIFKDTKFLLKDADALIAMKKGGGSMIYGLLLIIALLAIFDTQVLSIFRRQKEIGTYIALGMTRWRVVWIFTIEGSAHSILAIILGSLYGIPLMELAHRYGIPLPTSVDSYGITIADRIFPAYSIGLILSTVLLVVISATIVSYFPARRISKLSPTDALKGKIS
jgi:ABC-type lipoprotein release transport system permease subunit